MFLSGGPTARKAYERLAEVAAGPPVDWSRVDVYWGDERCVPPDDKDANQRLCRRPFSIGWGPSAPSTPCTQAATPAEAAAAYQKELAGLDRFDLVHLGMGPDGHCASLFPGSPALDAPDDVLVVASVDPNDNNPLERITLTLPAIARARLVVFTVAGPSKREAFERVRKGEDLPAGRVRAGEVLWLVDRDAAGDPEGA